MSLFTKCRQPRLNGKGKSETFKLKGDHFEISKNTGTNLRFGIENGDQRHN